MANENENIEAEVQARVNFKLDELFGAIKQAATRNWYIAFQSNSQKHSHYWEAFEEMAKMLEKERFMPPPYDEMAIKKRKMLRDDAVNTIVELVIPRGSHPPNERHIIRTIVSAVEKAQKY